jgi:hypothetical protein
MDGIVGTQLPDDPEPISGFAQAIGAIAEFHPEAMIVGRTGKIIRFLSDDGDVTDAAGTPCQELRDPNKQTFSEPRHHLPITARRALARQPCYNRTA